MENSGSAINDGEENLGSLIRASIDIDGWISDERTQLGGREDQDSNVFARGDERNVAEGTSYPHLEPRSSEFREEEFSELRKREMAASFVPPGYLPATDIGNCVFDGTSYRADDQSSREETGSCITLEKTPERTIYEEVANLREEASSELTVKKFNEANSTVGNPASSITHEEISENLPSFEVAFGKNRNNPYLEAAAQRFRTAEENQRRTVSCNKCREIIQPREWIRSIAVETGNTPVYHVNCFHCDYCKGVFCTDQYYTFHEGKLICNFDFQMLTNLRKVPDHNKKRLVVLHSVKKGGKKSVRMSLEQREILQQALRSKDRPTNIKNKP